MRTANAGHAPRCAGSEHGQAWSLLTPARSGPPDSILAAGRSGTAGWPNPGTAAPVATDRVAADPAIAEPVRTAPVPPPRRRCSGRCRPGVDGRARRPGAAACVVRCPVVPIANAAADPGCGISPRRLRAVVFAGQSAQYGSSGLLRRRPRGLPRSGWSSRTSTRAPVPGPRSSVVIFTGPPRERFPVAAAPARIARKSRENAFDGPPAEWFCGRRDRIPRRRWRACGRAASYSARGLGRGSRRGAPAAPAASWRRSQRSARR